MTSLEGLALGGDHSGKSPQTTPTKSPDATTPPSSSSHGKPAMRLSRAPTGTSPAARTSSSASMSSSVGNGPGSGVLSVAAQEEDTETNRAALEQFYKEHDPERAKNCPALFERYHQEDILDAFVDKYGKAPPGWSTTAYEAAAAERKAHQDSVSTASFGSSGSLRASSSFLARGSLKSFNSFTEVDINATEPSSRAKQRADSSSDEEGDDDVDVVKVDDPAALSAATAGSSPVKKSSAAAPPRERP